MNVNFFNKPASTADTPRTPCPVARIGNSLLPAVAAALIDMIVSGKMVQEKTLNPLLNQYLLNVPDKTHNVQQISATEQWRTMLRKSGAAVRISIEMAFVLKKIAYDWIEENPNRYIGEFTKLDNFKDNMAHQAEAISYKAVIAALADYLDLRINLKITDGECILPAKFHYGRQKTTDINIFLDKDCGQFVPLLHRPEKFQSMIEQPKIEDNLKLNLESYIESRLNKVEENINRLQTQSQAGEKEASPDTLRKTYIESIKTAGGKSLPSHTPTIGINPNSLQSKTDQLITAIATLQAISSPKPEIQAVKSPGR